MSVGPQYPPQYPQPGQNPQVQYPQAQYPQPQYPQAQYPQPQGGYPGPPARPARYRVPMIVAAALATGSAVLLIVGSFLNQLTYRTINDGEQISLQRVNGWAYQRDPAPSGSDSSTLANAHPPVYGIPIVVVALLLLVAAALAIPAARRAAGPKPATRAGVTFVAGAAAAAAVTWTIGLAISSAMSYEGDLGTDSFRAEYDLGPQLWFLIAATVLAVAAAVLGLVPAGRPPAPQQPTAQQQSSAQQQPQQVRQEDPSPPTPPSGYQQPPGEFGGYRQSYSGYS